MMVIGRYVVVLAIAAIATACGGDDATTGPPPNAATQFVNGFGAPVDVVVDGVVRSTAVPNGTLAPLALDPGDRSVTVRANGTSSESSLSIVVASGRPVTIAAMRGVGGALTTQTLDDTNAVVPANATKLRVLHLAPLAGEVQVWRTQPDYQTPIRWAFPFTYNSVNTYMQSTPGTWEVRVWTDTHTYPAGDSRGWDFALDAARVTLASGAKKTVVIVDKPGGGVKLHVID